jgi:hypothetical protein
MPDDIQEWYDDEAGPLVRLFAMTAGRARSAGEAFDLMATVQTNPAARDGPMLSPEQQTLLDLCRFAPQTVADIASESNLPVGVVRVLLGDLLAEGRILVNRPLPPSKVPDQRILREVINGLRAL